MHAGTLHCHIGRRQPVHANALCWHHNFRNSTSTTTSTTTTSSSSGSSSTSNRTCRTHGCSNSN